MIGTNTIIPGAGAVFPDQLDIFYVRQGGDDTANGKSIENAFETLDHAIDIAEAAGSYYNKNMIWVTDAMFYEINEKEITHDLIIYAPNADINLKHVTAVTGYG